MRNDQALQATKSARTSIDFQSTGTRVKYFIKFKEEKCDLQPCPKCGHKCCMPVKSVEDVNSDNDKRMNQYNYKLVTWMNTPVKDQGRKPTQPSTTSVKIGCFC